MRTVEQMGCTYLLFESFERHASLSHAVCTRIGGSSTEPFSGLNVSAKVGDDGTAVQKNRSVIAKILGLPIMGTRPTHGINCCIVDEKALTDRRRFLPWKEDLASQLAVT